MPAVLAFLPVVAGAVVKAEHTVELVRCEYCRRTQDRPANGGCYSCGAPLP